MLWKVPLTLTVAPAKIISSMVFMFVSIKGCLEAKGHITYMAGMIGNASCFGKI